MESSIVKRNEQRRKRVMRVRKRLRGSLEKPRLCVLRTNRHLSVQLIDDENHVTLASAGTLEKQYRGAELGKKSKQSAREIGSKIAELAKKQSIRAVIFDRGRYRYHGVIAELADAAREAGLQF